MNKVIKNKKVILVFIVTLSILFGVLIFNKLSNKNIEYIIKNISNLKYISFKVILFHILLLSISFILSFIGIGVLLLITYLFYEGITIGFMSAYFLSIYKLKGILYSGIYLLLFKSILIFLLIVLLSKYLKIFKNIINIIQKKKVDISKTVINIIVVNTLIIINDIFLLIFGNNLLNLLHFQ